VRSETSAPRRSLTMAETMSNATKKEMITAREAVRISVAEKRVKMIRETSKKNRRRG